jgi:multiple antibiotic resistance protein
VIELFLSAFLTLFVVIDPPGCAPIYAGLTKGASAAHRRVMAIRAVLVATAILVIFALFGQQLLRAGGIMLFLIALEMVFEKRTQRREERAQKVLDDDEIEDVSIFPMAMPMIAGPGSIAAIMLLWSQNPTVEERLVIGGAAATVLILTLIALIAAGPMMRVLGAKIEAVITRLLGVLLAALSVQFVVDGLVGSFGAAS